MNTVKPITNLKENFTEVTNFDLEENTLLEENRLNALIDRKLEEAMDSLHNGGKRYTFDEVDKIIGETISRAKRNV